MYSACELNGWEPSDILGVGRMDGPFPPGIPQPIPSDAKQDADGKPPM